MRELPRGTVTFLFTDIEGSTRLLKEFGEDYSDVLAEHQRLLRAAFAEAGGQEIDTQGDSFFVAFPRAKDAVRAAIAGQRGLAAHRWPKDVAVRVRMGLHTGEPAVGDERYVGIGVHKAARVAAAAHGGQILLSNTTRGLVEDELPPDVRLVDLGEHPLKDMDLPERIFQLNVPGLPRRFPPLRVEAHLPRARFPRTRLYPGRGAMIAAAALVLGGLIAALTLTLGDGDGQHAAGTGKDSVRSTAPGRDSGTIIAGTSIGEAKIGLRESEIEASYGEGSETQWRGEGRNGLTRTYIGRDAALSVSFFNGKVVQVSTKSSYYETEDGIHVGLAPPSPASPDAGAQERWDAALRSGAAIEIAPGVYSWRGFVYERESYCLVGNKSATHLVLKGPTIAHVVEILITDVDFLRDLPARVSYANTSYELACAPEVPRA